MTTTSWFKPLADKRVLRLYFAYGSNLNLDQMVYRCPNARFMCKGILPDHKLIFKRVADIEQCTGRYVAGGLFQITPQCLRALDRYEGYPRVYTTKNIKVMTEEFGIVDAFVYIMTPNHEYAMPTDVYYDTIRNGYHHCDLDYKLLKLAKRQTYDLVRHRELKESDPVGKS